MKTPTTYLDLRSGRRLTHAEGLAIINALDAGHVEAKRLRAKLLEAMEMATHKCTATANGQCPVCGAEPEARARVRARRAKDFRAALEASERRQQAAIARAREWQLRTKPTLKLSGETN